MKLKKNNVYIVRMSSGGQRVLTDLEILGDGFEILHDISDTIVGKKCCKRSYLRGAFLAGVRLTIRKRLPITLRFSHFIKSTMMPFVS